MNRQVGNKTITGKGNRTFTITGNTHNLGKQNSYRKVQTVTHKSTVGLLCAVKTVEGDFRFAGRSLQTHKENPN